MRKLTIIKILPGLIFLFGLLEVKAQDPHFSQYFSTPLLLNPASTGFFEGGQRLSVHFRQQWVGIGDPFITGAVSLDGQVLKNKDLPEDKLSYGVLALFDRSVKGALTNTYGGFSLAYHKSLDDDDKQSLGIGFQSIIGNKRLNYGNLSFFDQFSGDGFNTSLANGETLNSGSSIYFDFNIGSIYNYKDEDKSFYFGTSLYHITKPIQNFIGDTNYKLSRRFSIHSGGSMNLGMNGRIFSSILFMSQARAEELALGFSYEYFLPGDKPTGLILGMWLRTNDAIYPYLGAQTDNMLIGFSYDINTSSLSLASSKNKSLELSCILSIPDKKKMRKFIPWY